MPSPRAEARRHPDVRGGAGGARRAGGAPLSRRPAVVFGPGLLLAVFVALFARALFLGETFASRDLRGYARPLLSLVRPIVRASSGLPLWNPLVAGGEPFLGNPAHPLAHPGYLLLLVLPFELTFRLLVMLPTLVAAAGMAFLLRTLGRSRLAALFGALAWGFGGAVLSVSDLLALHLTLAPVPFLLAFTVRAARGAACAVPGMALALGLVLLAGEPVVPLSLVFLLPAALAAGAPRGAGRSRALVRVLAGLALGTAIGAATLLPGYAHMRRTDRAGGLPADVAGLWSFPPVRLLEVASPHAVARLSAGDGGAMPALYPGRGGPYVRSVFQGTAVLLLAAAALVRARRRLGPWLLSGAAGLLLALGVHTPVWDAARHLPLVSGVRFPEKFVLVPLLVLVLAAARGFDLLRAPRAGTRRLAAGFALALAAGALLLVPFAARRAVPPLPTDLLATTLLALTTGGLALAARRAAARRALVVLTAGELVVAGAFLVPTVPVVQVARPPAVLRPALSPPLPGPLFMDVSPATASRHPELGVLVPPAPAQWGIATVLGVDFAQTELRWSVEATRRFYLAARAEPPLIGPLLARRGVAAVLHDAPEPEGARLTRVAGRMPFAAFAQRLSFVAGGDGWDREVRRLGPLAASTVCLDEAERSRAPASPGPGVILAARRRPDALALDVRVPGPAPALLAVNETWDETWRATVDGRPAEVLRADLALMAIPVPPGAAHVALQQKNPWVTAGLALSGLGLLVAAAASLRGLRAPGASGAGAGT